MSDLILQQPSPVVGRGGLCSLHFLSPGAVEEKYSLVGTAFC